MKFDGFGRRKTRHILPHIFDFCSHAVPRHFVACVIAEYKTDVCTNCYDFGFALGGHHCAGFSAKAIAPTSPMPMLVPMRRVLPGQRILESLGSGRIGCLRWACHGSGMLRSAGSEAYLPGGGFATRWLVFGQVEGPAELAELVNGNSDQKVDAQS